jgi:F-type H+-transporting ATPase subunit alpha
VNVGLSVSRVGGAAQIKAMKQVAGTLRLDLAQFREKAAFAQFGSDLDPATQRQLARGQRLVEILKQPQYQPQPVEQQIITIFAGVNGFLDKYPTAKLRAFEEQFLQFLNKNYADVASTIASTQKIDDATKAKLEEALKAFDKIFNA